MGTDNGDHPGHDIAGNSYPNDAHHEGERVKSFSLWLPTIWNGKIEKTGEGPDQEPPYPFMPTFWKLGEIFI